MSTSQILGKLATALFAAFSISAQAASSVWVAPHTDNFGNPWDVYIIADVTTLDYLPVLVTGIYFDQLYTSPYFGGSPAVSDLLAIQGSIDLAFLVWGTDEFDMVTKYPDPVIMRADLHYPDQYWWDWSHLTTVQYYNSTSNPLETMWHCTTIPSPPSGYGCAAQDPPYPLSYPLRTEGWVTELLQVAPFTLAAVVPVPAAVWLFGTGLLGLLVIARKKAA